MNKSSRRSSDGSRTAARCEGASAQDDVPLRDKVAFLSSPEAYSAAPEAEVEVEETRMAWVFLVGERVYKLKKPVRNLHLDYSTLAARRQVCEDEVRLNRRLAGDVYLGLSRLTRASDGSLALDGDGEVVEWLVRMRGLPRARLLDNAIRANAVSQQAIERVADRLVRFYRAAPTANVDPADRVAVLTEELERGREVLAESRFAALARRGATIIDRRRALLDAEPGLVTAHRGGPDRRGARRPEA